MNSIKDGKPLSSFIKGDTVYRNYNNNYEEYIILTTEGKNWYLKNTATGYGGLWNIDETTGFILGSNRPAVVPNNDIHKQKVYTPSKEVKVPVIEPKEEIQIDNSQLTMF
jgi:hypothetical protein